MKPSDVPATTLIEANGETPKAEQPPNSTESLWGSFAKAGATLIAVLAAELSLIGHVAWATWLDHWGFDSGLMPLDATGRVIQGYVSVLDRGTAFLSTWAGLSVALAFIGAGIYLSIVLTARTIAKRHHINGTVLPEFVRRAPWWAKDIATAFGISGFGLAGVYCLLMAALLILVTGPAIGQGAARSWAARTEVQIQKGCKGTGEHGACTQVSRDGKLLATGFVLASSTKHVAVYDVTSKRTRMLSLDGLELTGWAP